MHHLIAPSILAADFGNLDNDCEMVNNSQADWFHIGYGRCICSKHFIWYASNKKYKKNCKKNNGCALNDY